MLHDEQPSREMSDATSGGSAADQDPDPWDIVAARLESFLEQWESGPDAAPRIADHLPEGPADVRHMVLVELVKIDLEYRRKHAAPVMSLEDYLTEHPELAGHDGLPADLIHEEYHIRRAAGESVDAASYLERFPDRAETLCSLFEIDPTAGASAVTGADIQATWQPGDRIGDFLLLAGLGEGAFGCVYLARQESMQRMVALKVSGDTGSEGQTLAQLDHPHIVRVYDQCSVAEQNLRLLYMQFVPGGTLQSVIRFARSKPRAQWDGVLFAKAVAQGVRATGFLPSPDEATQRDLFERTWSQVVSRLGSQLAGALHYAHLQGILHRDVKPANVLLEPTGSGRLADFNISYSSELEAGKPTDNFGGSVAYMSPEQLEAFHPDCPRTADDLDPRCDVYALGVVLWETMYGARPFADEEIEGSWKEGLSKMIALRIVGAPEAPVTPQDPLDRELLRVLQRCLAPNREDRFDSAAELARELRLCQQSRVAKILHDGRHRWPSWAIRHPVMGLVIGGLIPNGLAGFFNYSYNHSMIIGQLTARADDPGRAETMFNQVQLVINSIAFPVGLLAGVWYMWPVLWALGKARASGQVPTSPRLRGRSLAIGSFAAGLGIVEWTIAGVAYPVSLHWILGELRLEENIHFFSSLLICGMIAAAYPFFLLSAIAVRAFFPVLLRGNPVSHKDAGHLRAVSRRIDLFLALAGGVPAAGILFLVISGFMNHGFGSSALAVLSATGFFGFLFTLSLSRSLQADVQALLETVDGVVSDQSGDWGNLSAVRSTAPADQSRAYGD